ncbi:hypothetical protein D9M71_276180 [compost metagenome]
MLLADDVPGILATQHPATFEHLGHHVAVADLGAHEGDVARRQGQLQAQIAHQGADHSGPFGQTIALLEIGGNDVKQLVAIDHGAGMVDHQHPVAVAVEGDAHVGTLLEHRFLQRLHVGGADPGVDVETVRLRGDHRHLGAQLAEYAGRHLVGGAMGAVEHQLEAGEIGAGRHAALAELDVAAGRVVDPRRLAQLRRLDHAHRRIEQLLDHQLDLVRQLGSLAGEELDAVVVVRIVRGTDDDPGIGMEGAGQVGHRRGGHRTEQHHVGARGNQSGLQGRLEHVAGDPRVLADQYLAVALATERHAGGPAQPEHELGGDRKFADPSANAVGTKIFSAHSIILLSIHPFHGGNHANHIHRLGHVVHPHDLCALGHRQRGQRQATVQPLTDRAIQRPTDHALARYPDQQRQDPGFDLWRPAGDHPQHPRCCRRPGRNADGPPGMDHGQPAQWRRVPDPDQQQRAYRCQGRCRQPARAEPPRPYHPLARQRRSVELQLGHLRVWRQRRRYCRHQPLGPDRTQPVRQPRRHEFR